MTQKNRSFPFFKSLTLVAALVTVSSVHGAETAEGDAVQNPWGFNLTLYTWLPGVSSDFSVGPLDKSVDADFIDIVGKLSNFPLAFNGHFEAHYERLGIYLDGNYMEMDFKPKFDHGITKGLSMVMGIMDYGVTYRLFGSPASETAAHWSDNSRSNSFDIYACGRTIWLDSQIDFRNISSASASTSSTAPLMGARIITEFLPKWLLLLNGDVGGFGVDNVSFTASALGAVGYRTSLFGIPATVQAGYKVLNVQVNKGGASADVTMNGPAIGLTGYW